MSTMSYRGYTASMTFDAEDKILVGRVIDIVDIIAFHGESVTEFETNFHLIVDDYIDVCQQAGELPEKPASGKLMLRIEPSVHAAAIKAAARSGTSLNRWAEQVIKDESFRALSLPLATATPSTGADAKPKSPRNRLRTRQVA